MAMSAKIDKKGGWTLFLSVEEKLESFKNMGG